MTIKYKGKGNTWHYVESKEISITELIYLGVLTKRYRQEDKEILKSDYDKDEIQQKRVREVNEFIYKEVGKNIEFWLSDCMPRLENVGYLNMISLDNNKGVAIVTEAWLLNNNGGTIEHIKAIT